MKRLEQLELAFDFADEYVLTRTQCPIIAQISNGRCDIWAKAVRRKAKFANIREKFGHYYVVFDAVAHDSQHGIGNGSEPDICCCP